MTARALRIFVSLCVLLGLVRSVSAQPLGTYKWQLTPYCNVVTLAATQVGSQYRLEGYDDQCGLGPRAAVTGLVVPNLDGTYEFGLTIVTATGALPAHVDVTFNVATLGGPWRDNTGATGTFVFGPALPAAGSARPAPYTPIPDAAVTSAKLATSAVTSAHVLDGTIVGADVNPAFVQLRVNGACGVGHYMQSVNPDGSVLCNPDVSGTGTITSVSAGAGLGGGGSSGPVSLNVNFAGSGGTITAARSDHTHEVSGSTGTSVGSQAGSGGFVTAVGYQALQNNSSGPSNTAVGAQALRANTTGASNTAVGSQALGTTTASSNTAVGYAAMAFTSTGANNTAVGADALDANTVGASNVAVGRNALGTSVGADQNTAVGASALALVATGENNTAVGFNAMAGTTSGQSNVAVGATAMDANAIGNDNVAIGFDALTAATDTNGMVAIGRGALEDMVVGNESTAVGFNSLAKSTSTIANVGVGSYTLFNASTGFSNVAIGSGALIALSTGDFNIALGHNAGSAQTIGNDNVYIDSNGVAGESDVTRIGSGKVAVFMSGISGVNVVGTNVQVNGSGQLGVVVSSARFKQQIAGMGDVRAEVQALRPVTFYYKPEFDDGSRVRQYRLIAEEVADVLPGLVVYDEQGQAQTVRYHFLPTLLLAEVQRLERERAEQERRLSTQAQEIAELRALVDSLVQRR